MCRHAPTRHTRTLPHPRLHAPASRAHHLTLPLPMRRWASPMAQDGAQGVCPPRLLRSGCRRFQHVPPCTNATHAHSATPPPSRASKSRTSPHPAASNAALGVAHGARWGARRLPAETLEIGLPPLPACAAMHQRDTRTRTHTPAIHAPASPARLPHRTRARIPLPSRVSKPCTSAAPHIHARLPLLMRRWASLVAHE